MQPQEVQPLYLSPGLTERRVCVPLPEMANGDCFERDEWFFTGAREADQKMSGHNAAIRLQQPVPGLLLALDPRLPEAAQAYEFRIEGTQPSDEVRIRVGSDAYVATDGRLLWPLSPGVHEVSASVWRGGKRVASVSPFSFTVR